MESEEPQSGMLEVTARSDWAPPCKTHVGLLISKYHLWLCSPLQTAQVSPVFP